MRAILAALVVTLFITDTFAQARQLQITPLTGNFYIYTTYNLYKETLIPANGMYLVTDKGVVMFDTPWDTTQFQPLLDSIEARHHQRVVLCIATHFHDDRTGGLTYYQQKGIRTYTTVLTDSLSKKNGHPRAEFLMTKDTTFKVGNYAFETYYPGHGHAPDNIVIWFEQERILYGACLIKSWEDEDLGYLGDANTIAYANTIKHVQEKCKRPNYVIVGHGDWTKVQSLQHTRKMAETLRKRAIKATRSTTNTHF